MNIAEMRERSGLNRAEFAKLLGVPYRSVENWEKGLSKPPEYVPKLIENKLKADGIIKDV